MGRLVGYGDRVTLSSVSKKREVGDLLCVLVYDRAAWGIGVGPSRTAGPECVHISPG